MKRIFALLLTLALSLSLTACASAKIEDTNGADNFALNTITDQNILKLDLHLTRGIDKDATRRAIVAGIVHMCDALAMVPVAEGIETEDEMRTVLALGITRMQGYLFARPAFEQLPEPFFP